MFELTPWRPFGELRTLRREMDKLWEEFFGNQQLTSSETAWMPAIDISETKDAIVVRAEVPGMKAEDIEINLTGDILTIKGEKKHESEEKDENFHRIETRYGAFQRVIRVPVTVDSNKIQAKYEKGILKVTLPKREEAKPKQIEVKVE